MIIRRATARDFEAILGINAQGRPGVAPLDARELEWFDHHASHFLVAEADREVVGYLFALAPTIAYDGEEYRWFASRSHDFLYIDQVAVAERARSRGVATLLYVELQHRAKASGLTRLVCEVNLHPPNPASMAFHLRRGFRELTTLDVGDGRKVQLLELVLD